MNKATFFINEKDRKYFIQTERSMSMLKREILEKNGLWKKKEFEMSKGEDILNVIEKNLINFSPIHHPFSSRDDKKFRCPVCKHHPLYVTRWERLYTLDEWISDPLEYAYNKPIFQCLNDYCAAFKYGLGWDYYGALYQMREHDKDLNVKFIDDNNAPFGSLQRQANVETSKKDENFSLFTFKNWKVDIHYRYKADTNGTILKRKRYIQLLRKDDKIGAWVYHTLGIKMLFFSIRNFNLNIKNKKEITCWKLREDADWWRKVAAVYLKLRHPKDVTFEKEVHPDMFKRSRLISFVEKYIK